MQILIDFLWLILFFVAYILYPRIPETWIDSINQLLPISLQAGDSSHSIYFATLVAMVSFIIMLVVQSLYKKKITKMQWITFLLLILLGGATLAFKDPTFIKWKPTVVNWLFAAVFLGSLWIGKQPLVERLMGHAVAAPREVWLRLNMAWVLFFVALGLLNLIVAYQFSEETWVKIKSFGFLGLTVVFVIFQTIYLSRYITAKNEE